VRRLPNPSEFLHKVGPYAHRLQPKTMRLRIAGASAAFTLFAIAVTFASTQAAAFMQLDRLARSTAETHLGALRTFVDAEQRQTALFAGALALTEPRSGMAPMVASPARAAVLVRLDQTSPSVLVRLDARGRVAYSKGAPGDVEAVRVAAAQPSGSATGMLWLSGGTSTFAREAVYDGKRSLGVVALARPIAPAVRSTFAPLSEDLSVQLTAPRTLPAGQATLFGFRDVTISVSRGMSRTIAVLPGVGGQAAGVAQLTLSDPRTSSSYGAARATALGAALLVGLVGAGLGLALAEAVRAPIARTREHLHEQAAVAMDGLPCPPLATRPETSEEFRELAKEVDALLSALTTRHAELLAATEQAHTAEASLRAAIDYSPEVKLLVENGRVALANVAAEQILGVPAEALVGASAAKLMAEAEVYAEDGHRLGVADFSSAAEHPLVVRLAPPDAPERWLALTAVPHANDHDRLLLTARDITEERRLEAMREEIFSLVSHDLRAPLTVVQGYLDILERPLQPEARRRALESARHNAARMSALLEDLLDATAAEQLLAPKVFDPVDVAALANEVASSLRQTAPDRTIRVAADCAPIVSGEERRLRQAVVNLVENALKYADGDTEVTIRVECRGAHALIAVEDEGPGVPRGSREAVFERYGRLASAEGKPGLGLGLYIVRLIAEKHGGCARVEDAPRGGARFVLELPLAEGCEEVPL
jgi:PAS domain S-box-containing protein